MAKESAYRYGEPNFEMLGRWLQLAPAEDGPFWALNLMKYHAVADYRSGEGDGTARTGREADDEYAPLESLAAIGAMVAFHGDVVAQTSGDPKWDRVGIVRYPSRAAFFEMQRRDDFKRKHVHKEAGMEFTIVMSCLPVTTGDAGAEFEVEGVIVGDDRRYDTVHCERSGNEVTFTVRGPGDEHVCVVQPALDELAASVEGATA